MSSEAKHTPGPWEIVSQSIETGCLGIGPANERFIVATVHNGPALGEMLLGHAPTKHFANARLIAAAPDLFTVVSKLLAARNTAPDALAFSIAVDEFIEEAEAAFNQATGT